MVVCTCRGAEDNVCGLQVLVFFLKPFFVKIGFSSIIFGFCFRLFGEGRIGDVLFCFTFGFHRV